MLFRQVILSDRDGFESDVVLAGSRAEDHESMLGPAGVTVVAGSVQDGNGVVQMH
jgi:hypothetical protein